MTTIERKRKKQLEKLQPKHPKKKATQIQLGEGCHRIAGVGGTEKQLGEITRKNAKERSPKKLRSQATKTYGEDRQNRAKKTAGKKSKKTAGKRATKTAGKRATITDGSKEGQALPIGKKQ